MRPFQFYSYKLWSSISIYQHLSLRSRKWFSAGHDILQEGDRALLYFKSQRLLLTKPLRRDDKTATKYGDVRHDSLIGKHIREIVSIGKNRELWARLPSLEEYITMTPRLVTPIYAKDANLIVSLLDLHPSATPHSPENRLPLEILEAGTGHGALTLHLTRAIHAANPLPMMYPHTSSIRESSGPMPKPSFLTTMNDSISSLAASMSRFLGNSAKVIPKDSQAVIHTIDISSKHSNHAKKILNGFRRGQYANDVKFYVGDVSEWIDEQVVQRQKYVSPDMDQGFLSHIILDLPSSHTHIEKASSALHVNGSLLVFNPSITQIGACVKMIKKDMLPLHLDRILELGHTTGGREWDVRVVKPRAVIRAENEKQRKIDNGNTEELTKESCASSPIEESSKNEPAIVQETEGYSDDDAAWEMVCRPKVGERIVGGGFLGVWKKMRQRSQCGTSLHTKFGLDD